MNAITSRYDRVFLLIGDLFLFYLALYVTLIFRYLEVPPTSILMEHIASFTILFSLWVIVFYIAGLYDRQTAIIESRLPSIILYAQVTNIIIAALFFFVDPFFSIAPKTNLFIYLIISFGFIVAWRLYLVPLSGVRHREPGLLLASGEEMERLKQEVNENQRVALFFADSLNPKEYTQQALEKALTEKIEATKCKFVVADMQDPALENLLLEIYKAMFDGTRFLDANQLYEEIFCRVPPALLARSSLISYLSPRGPSIYDALKRIIDIAAAIGLGVVSLLITPFVIVAIKLEDRGPIFIKQNRIGQFGHPISVLKFRSMQRAEEGVWVGETDNQITKVGTFLRKTRIDELPQLWNILRGDLSLIGPRTDVVGLATRLMNEIPYYGVRYLVKPGVTGWAQIRQDTVPHSLDETKERLSYDLYYIKNRSLLLDVSIFLRTIKTVLSRSGR